MDYRVVRTFLYIVFFCIRTVFTVESDTIQKAITTKVTPFYSQPKADFLPKGYLKKGDTSAIHEVSVDSLGNPWFRLVIKASSAWSPAKYWLYISLIDTSAFIEGRQNDEDKKRRLRILREHRDWPRRIIRAVRFGRICLDITGQQLSASWGEPKQKSTAFTIGLGNHTVWIYNEESQGSMTAVILKNDQVIGWTSK